jgi:photosystem II stability/assembly factor-like uncharacterized protein
MRKLFALVALAALPALASGRWTIGGPDGGSVTRLVFDPADSSIVYAASSNGLFRSADGGRHWLAAAALLGTRIGDIAVAKSDPRTAFAATGYGLYKSSDRGASWRLVQSDSWFRVAVSAQNPDVVYSVSFSGPVLSTDGGTTFGKAGIGLPTGGLPSAIAVDPRNAAIVYASFPSSAGVYKSSDGGAHWAKSSDGLTSQVFALAVDPTDGASLYACGSASAMFKSTNGAASWTRLDTGTSGLTCAALEVSPSAPSTILTATGGATLLSRDGGASWSAVAGIPDTGASAVAFDPASAETFLAALAIHMLRTTDGGATSVVSESGLTAFVTRAVAVDPRDDAVVYAGGPGGFARSADHGRTWSLSTALQPAKIAVDANASTLYAITGTTVQRSIDGGITWSPFGDGLPAVAPFFLAADPRLSGTLYAIVNGAVYKKVGDGAWTRRSDGLGDSMDFVIIDPSDSSTLYAGGPLGIFKSSNGASSWAPANNGLTGLNAFGLSVDPFDSRHLFAWSPTVIFESSDAAASWTRLTTGPRGTRDFDPSTRGVVYANAFDGVQRSSDGGTRWSLLAEGLPKSHSTLVVGAAGTPYLGDSSGGVFVYHFVHGRAVGR